MANNSEGGQGSQRAVVPVMMMMMMMNKQGAGNWLGKTERFFRSFWARSCSGKSTALLVNPFSQPPSPLTEPQTSEFNLVCNLPLISISIFSCHV
jgi:hypothetical protein